MKNYLFYTQNDYIFYFFRQGGIYLKRGKSAPKLLCSDCRGVFSVLYDDIPEILFLSTGNELIYFLPDTGQRHILAHIGEGMELLQLRLFKLAGRTHFIYSARYRNEILLVYSPLNNNAMPKTLIKLKNPWFCLYKDSVYVTVLNGATGYIDLSRPEPVFNRITDNAEFVSLFAYNGTDMLTYKKGDGIFFQNCSLCTDTYAENPILFAEENNLFLMWKSRGFIYFKKSTDFGKSWSGVGRIITPEREAELVLLFYNGQASPRYADSIKGTPRLLGFSPQIGEKPAAHTAVSAESRIKELLQIKKELDELKKYLSQNDLF